MEVVIDANLVAALVLPVPYSEQVTHCMTVWKSTGVALYAPVLLEYEVATILRRAMAAGLMSSDVATSAMRNILALGIRFLPPTCDLHNNALRWAACLGHSKACDAHYLALAEQLRADLWTADKRLVDSAPQADLTWVHWIGDTEVP